MSKRRRRWMGCVTFLLSLSICLFAVGAYIKNKNTIEYIQMEQILMTSANKVSSVINKLLYKTEILSALVIQNDGEVMNFEEVAATIIDDPCIRNVILAPDGVVSDVYPMKGNEAVIGLDYFSEGTGNKEAIQARDTKQLVLGGPFETVQGGMALVGRLPVYLEQKDGSQKFWGIVSVTLNYPEALSGAELEVLETKGLAFELWRVSPDSNKRQMIANSDYHYSKDAAYVEQNLIIQNADWYFRLSPIRNWYQYPETWILTFCSLVISVLFLSLVIHNYDLKCMKSELEWMTKRDALTGVYNRRGLFYQLEKILQKPKCVFVLCYMDLNSFKKINDTYGHLKGDEILQDFADLVTKRITTRHVFARIGGDEFVLVLKDTDKCQEAKELVDDLMEKALDIRVGEETLSFSAGMAAYPHDGRTIDEIIRAADKEMYARKKGESSLH